MNTLQKFNVYSVQYSMSAVILHFLIFFSQPLNFST